MGRSALRLGVVCLLAPAGAASALFAAGPRADRAAAGTLGTTIPAAPVSTTTTSRAGTVLAVDGRGFGHGLGLSQWGAYGYAQHGWTYRQILAHYYPGTTLGAARATTVRVLVAQAASIRLGSTAAWSVVDASGAKTELQPGTLVLKSKLAPGGRVLQAPFTFTGREPLTVAGKPYRGRLVVSFAGQQAQVVDVAGLEAYLKGVVPAEMPSTWSPAALEAQAVAARSYALANLRKGLDWNLYGDTRDQAYGGVEAESPQASAAVDATRGQVVLYNGTVADALYFSTSGGRTASAAEATGTAVPYLVPVADPYDTASPYHVWGPVLYDAAAVVRRLKLAGPLVDLRTENGPSGRVQTVVAVSADEAEATFTGAQIRAALDLRSTWFNAALLSLAPAAKTMIYGGALSLSGFARGVAALSLEAKPAGGDWAPAGALTLDAGGSFSVVVRPRVSTQYRLAWGGARAGLARIAVAPLVSGTVASTGGQGQVRPALQGAPVQLQRQDGAGWTTVQSGSTTGAGSWVFAGGLAPGAYRVRCAPGQGLAAGASATFQVT